MRSSPAFSRSGPTSLSTAPTSRPGRLAAMNIDTRPPSEVPIVPMTYVLHIGERDIGHRVPGIGALAAADKFDHDRPPPLRDIPRERFEIADASCEGGHGNHGRGGARPRGART